MFENENYHLFVHLTTIFTIIIMDAFAFIHRTN